MSESLRDARYIRTLWITRKSIDSGFHPPELIAAWDEWSIDENPGGWQFACKEELDSIGNDLASHRYIDLRVSGEALSRAFDPVDIAAEVAE